jgi:hypothetical protein
MVHFSCQFLYRRCSISRWRRQKLEESLQKAFPIWMLFCLVLFSSFNLLLSIKFLVNTSLIFIKSFKNSFSILNITLVFSICFAYFLKRYSLRDFSNFCLFAEKVLFLISYIIWNNKFSDFCLSFPSEKWFFLITSFKRKILLKDVS